MNSEKPASKTRLISKLKSIGITMAVLLPIFLILYNYTFDAKIFTGGDNASYYALGKAIANGDGYTNTHIAGGTAANHFPPGYSFIIGVHMTLFGKSLMGVKILNGLFLFGCLILCYIITKRLSNSKPISIITTLLLLFNAHYLHYGSIVMSEVPFSFFSLLGLLLLLKVDINKKFYKDTNFILLVLTIAGLIYIRTIGVALFGGAVLYFLFQRKILHSAIMFGTVVFLLVPWQIRSHNLGGTPYVKQLLAKDQYDLSSEMVGFSDIMVRFQENASRYISKEIPNALFPARTVQYTDENGVLHSGDLLSWIFGLLLITIMVIGIIKTSRKKEHYLLGMILGFTIVVLLFWPSVWYGTRFIMPTIPILYYLLVNGTTHLITKFFRKVFNLKSSTNLNWVPYFFVLALMATIPTIKAVNKYAERDYHVKMKMYLQLGEMCKNMPDNTVIVCRKPHLFHLVSEQIVCNFKYTDSTEAQREYFNSLGVTHVVMDQLGFPQTQKYLGKYIQQHAGKFKVVKQTSQPVNYLLEYNDTLGYEGERVEGKKSGYGTFVWEDGNVYEGNWENDVRSGYGILYSSSGMIYESQWKDDKRNGEGTVRLTDSTYIEMFWVDNQTDTLSRLYSKDGEFVKYVNFNRRRE